MKRRQDRVRFLVRAGTITSLILIVGFIVFETLVNRGKIQIQAIEYRATTRTTTPTTHPADWTLDDQRRLQLSERIGAIHLGDRKEDVTHVLGPPDEDHVVAPKGFHVTPLGTLIRYQFVRYENGFVNELWDQYVYLEFNTDDRLQCIYSSVPSIESRGHFISK